MTATLAGLRALEIPPVIQDYEEKDVILYALGLGLGGRPTDRAELAFVYEENLEVLPSMATVLAHPGFWVRDLDTGLDWRRVMHGEQYLTLDAPLPPSGHARSESRIAGVIDKGSDKGALINYERVLYVNGRRTAVVRQIIFCRGDGGVGSFGEGPPVSLEQVPSTPPDATFDLTPPPQAALIYRLSGDLNPLHADPNVAASAGFDRPILHGLATYGVAAFGVLRALSKPTEALRRLDCRFRSPVYPGERLRTSVWRDGGVVRFDVRAADRDVLVLSHGLAEIS